MANGTEENSEPKKRGRHRKTPQIGARDRILEKVLHNGREGDSVGERSGVVGGELPNINERVLESNVKRVSKMKLFFSYLYKFRGQFCLICFVTVLALFSGLPWVFWSLDREPPYKMQHIKIQSGYPGQLVEMNALIKERTIGRVCGVIVNGQAIGSDGKLAFVSQTRMIAGEAIQKMPKDRNGNILFKTDFQVPPTLAAGVADLVIHLDMICADNQSHPSRPIHGVIERKWYIEQKPADVKTPSCPRKAIK